MNIDKEITTAIEKNLPAAVGDVLRERLEQADQDASELAALKVTAGALNEKNKELMIEKEKLRATLECHEDINLRRDKVEARERALDIEVLKVQLAAEQRVALGYKDFLSTLVKSPMLKETVLTSETKQHPQAGGYMPSTCDSKTATSTRESE